MTIPTIALAIVIRFLPRARHKKRPKIRRSTFPFMLAAKLFLALLLLAPIPVWLTSHKFDLTMRVGQILFLLTAYFYWLGVRARTPSADEAQAIDSRAPVLYLRSFDQEDRIFAATPPKPARYYAYEQTQDAFDPHYATFEEYFALAASQVLGPMMALGAPFDRLPHVGAPRKSIADDQWQQEFRNLASRSCCILATAEFTASMEIEFTLLRNHSLLEKTFIFTPPDFSNGSRLTRFRFWMSAAFNQSPRARKRFETAWPALLEGLRRLELPVHCSAPGPGAILAFDNHGRLILWATGMRSAWEYLDVVQEWVKLDPNTRSVFSPCFRAIDAEASLAVEVDALTADAVANPTKVRESLESEILPRWRTLRDTIAAITVIDTRFHALQQRTICYMDETTACWRDYLEAMSKGDVEMQNAVLARKRKAKRLLDPSSA
jgi:hypothetical protein